MAGFDHVPVVEVTRGEIVESVHYGAFCVVSRDGKIIAQAGNLDGVTYPRSSLKPLQVVPFIERSGATYFDFSGEEIAIMCGSHAGTAIHTAILEGMHYKISCNESNLACGVHWPYDKNTQEAMKLAGQSPTAFHHNCSGKHTGMLALAQLLGEPLEGYLNANHPVQLIIRKAIGEITGLAETDMPAAIDGCSAPVYGIPLKNMAQAVASMAEPAGLEPARQVACKLITSAMILNPVMVAGPGQFDTDLMRVGNGKLFSKGGAEGYQIIGVLPGVISQDSPGVGMAIKIADGDARGRARACVVLSLLKSLGVFAQDELDQLAGYGDVPVKNWRDLEVGRVRPAFSDPVISWIQD